MIYINNNFNLIERKKLLHKRKRRRKAIFRLSILSITIFTLFINIIINIQNSNKTVAKFIITSPKNIVTDKFVICIDPGHGDFDIGTEGVNSKEKDIVLAIGLKLGELLNTDDSIKVIYTRATDSYPWITTANDSLKERINISKVSKADIFISIHCNSNNNVNEAKGIETWYKPNDPESKYLASLIQTELANLNNSIDRGLKVYTKENELAVIEKNSAISVLTELGFLSNISDENFLLSENGQNQCAQALYNAIIKYKEEL